jgi:hypothetical protein
VRHGLDVFDFSIICEIPNEELNAREIHEIATRETLAPKGYNLKKGGDNHEMHESTRLKLSEAQKGPKSHRWGKKNTAEQNAKISASNSGPNNRFYGKHLSDEEKDKIRKTSPSAKKVNQYTLEGVFLKTWDSTKQAMTEAKDSSIGDKCKGLMKTTKFLWTYYIEGQDPKIYIAPENRRKKREKVCKPERESWYMRNRDAINAKRRAAPKKPKKPLTEEQKAQKREYYQRTKALKNNLVSEIKE